MAQHNTSQGFLTFISENYISPSIPLQKELPYILMYNPLTAHVELIHGEHIFDGGGRILVRYTLQTVFI